jgi:hypothetical protein
LSGKGVAGVKRASLRRDAAFCSTPTAIPDGQRG